MAMDFESGSSQSVDLGLDIPALNGKAGCGVMAWVIVESLAAERAITEIAIGPPPGSSETSRLLFTILPDGKVRIGARDDDGGSAQILNSTAGDIVVGTFHHVVGVVDIANDLMQIYVDGVQVASATREFSNTTFPATNSKNGGIGSNDDGTVNFFDGIMEDWRLYSRVLSAEEIQTIHAVRGTDGIVDGLEHRYLMNEKNPGATATGVGSVKDSGPRQRNVDPVNSPVYLAGDLRFRRRVA